MLLLRATLGIALIAQGGLCLGQADTTFGANLIGTAAILAGALLFLGFLTPIVGVSVAIGAIGVGLSILPACTPALFGTTLPAVFAGVMLLAVIALGPGAFSIDARLFGRREIIIPPLDPRPQ